MHGYLTVGIKFFLCVSLHEINKPLTPSLKQDYNPNVFTYLSSHLDTRSPTTMSEPPHITFEIH